MSDVHIPYLCGGTFFFLLLQAKYTKTTSPQDYISGTKEDMADRHIMNKLVYAITGKNSYCIDSTLKKDTSNYRECKINGSINIPFNNTAVSNAYFLDIKNKNPEILKRMTEFTDTYINPAMYEWIVCAVLEVIEDDFINDNTEFYISSDGTPISKTELLAKTKFEIQPFIMGIMLFILQNRTDNIKGADTLNAWGTKAGNQERKFTNRNLGTRSKKPISVTRIDPDYRQTEEFKDEAKEKTTSDEVINDKNKDNITIIKNQNNIIQNGEENFNLTNNGTINFNF